MKNKIAVVGDKDSVMLFKAVGLEVRYAQNVRDAEQAIHSLARDGYPVIYVTEQVAEQAAEAIALYDTSTFPAIIPIPDKDGIKGIGMQGIRKNVEKAVGADILFGEGR